MKTIYKLALSLTLIMISLVGCEQYEIVERGPEVIDEEAPELELSDDIFTTFRGDEDTLEVEINVSDAQGVYMVKVSYDAWDILETHVFPEGVKDETVVLSVPVPKRPEITNHTFTVAVLDFGYNDMVSNFTVQVERKPGSYDEMFILGDMSLTGRAGLPWDNGFAERMDELEDSEIFGGSIVVYNPVANGELKFITARGANGEFFGKKAGTDNELDATSSDPFIIENPGYYTIILDFEDLKVSIEPLTVEPASGLEVWITGQGMTNVVPEWTENQRVQFDQDPNNGYSFTFTAIKGDGDIWAKTYSDNASWASAWGSIQGFLNPHDLMDGYDFEIHEGAQDGGWTVQSQPAGNKYSIVVDRYLSKRIVVPIP